MTGVPEAVVQRQLDACNAHDLVACYAEDVAIQRLPASEPALRGRAALADFHARERFNREGLHAELVNRLTLDDKVADHECIRGIRPGLYQAVAVYQVTDALIRNHWRHPIN